MGKRKLKKRAKKLAKMLEEIRERMSFRFVGGGPQGVEAGEAVKALFEKIAAHYRDRVQAKPETIPDRCPCGKKWKNCNHRDELLGTQGSA